MNKKFFLLEYDIGSPVFRATFKCDPAFPAAAAIETGGNVVTSVINGLFARSENKKARQWSEHMYDRELQDSLAQWERENKYNSPENQKALLQQAGLNPNLLLNNHSNLGSAESMNVPSHNSVSPTVPQFGNPFAGFANAMLAQAQIEKTQAEIDSIYNGINLNTAEMFARLRQMGVDYEHSKDFRDFYRQSIPFELQGKSLDNRAKSLNIDLLRLEKDSKEIMNNINNENLKTLRAHNVYVDESAAIQIARERQQLKNDVLQGEVSIAQAAAFYASSVASYASANLSDEQRLSVAYDRKFKEDNEVFFIGQLAQDLLNSSQMNEKQKRELEQLNADIEYAKMRNQSYPVDKLFNRLGSIIGVAATAAGIFFGAKAVLHKQLPPGNAGSPTDRLPYGGFKTTDNSRLRTNSRGVPPRRSGTRANASRGGFSRTNSSNGITYNY